MNTLKYKQYKKIPTHIFLQYFPNLVNLLIVYTLNMEQWYVYYKYYKNDFSSTYFELHNRYFIIK